MDRRRFLRGVAALGGVALGLGPARRAIAWQSSAGAYSPVYPTGSQFEISYGDQYAAVTEVGATLRSYRVGGREVLDTFGIGEPSDASRGQVLIPWPNRIDHGRYEFGGQENQLPINEVPNDNAIHGLTRWMSWRLLSRTSSQVLLGLRLYPQDGWPFILGVEISYALSDAGLTVTTGVQNLGSTPMPFGIGHHPYITVGTPTIDTATLRLPARTYLKTNERLIPTGRAGVEGTRFDFRGGRRIGDTRLDTCFTDVIPDPDGYTRVTLSNPEDGFTVTVAMDPSHRYIQAYTGDTLPEEADRRRGIAIEPMTCAPNAFNSGDGLRVLQPGEVFVSSWALGASYDALPATAR